MGEIAELPREARSGDAAKLGAVFGRRLSRAQAARLVALGRGTSGLDTQNLMVSLSITVVLGLSQLAVLPGCFAA